MYLMTGTLQQEGFNSWRDNIASGIAFMELGARWETFVRVRISYIEI
jgi:hypothetical protein